MVVEAVIGGYGTDSWHDLLLHVPDNDKGKLADCQRPSWLARCTVHGACQQQQLQ